MKIVIGQFNSMGPDIQWWVTILSTLVAHTGIPAIVTIVHPWDENGKSIL
jgi:hypothetical protein